MVYDRNAWSLIDKAFSLWKNDLGKFAFPAVEAYLIRSIAMVLTLPLSIIMMVIFFISNFSDEGITGQHLMVLGMIFVFFYPIVTIVQIITLSLINSGLAHVSFGLLQGGKYRFGDIFRFGKGRRMEFFWLVFFDSLFIGAIISIIVLIFITISVVLIILTAGLGVCLLMLFMPLLLIPIFALMPLQYLPFIIKYREGLTNYQCLRKSFDMLLSDLGLFITLGFYVSLITIVLAMIPGLSIIIGIFMVPFMFTVFCIYYQETLPSISYPKRPTFQ